jgi:hypothetical protein
MHEHLHSEFPSHGHACACAAQLRALLIENLALARELARAQQRVTRLLGEKDARIRALQALLRQTAGQAPPRCAQAAGGAPQALPEASAREAAHRPR